MNTPSFSKKSLFALCAIGVTCLSALSYASPHFQFDDAQIQIKTSTTASSIEAAPINNTTELDTTDTSPETIRPVGYTELPEPTAPKVRLEIAGTHVAPDFKLAQQNTSTITSTSFDEAKRALNNAQYTHAAQLFKELADQGDAQAQVALGEMLWYGDGILPDIPLARTWFSKAAAQGNAKAQQFVELLFEREKRSNEIGFYTTNFDGGNLKWKEDFCPRPQLPAENLTQKLMQSTVTSVNSRLECYNSYVNMLKNNLAEMRYLPPDLKRIMRTEEIEQAAQLTRDLYYRMGLQAHASTNQVLTQYKQWSERWLERWKSVEFENQKNLTLYMNKRFNEDLEHRSMIKPETGERTVTPAANPTEKK